MRCRNVFVAFIVVFFVFLINIEAMGIVSASFTLSEEGSLLVTEYGISDYLEADMNISFFNESLNSTFEDSEGNSIQLGALLAGAPEYFYIFYDTSNTTISSAFQILTLTGVGFQMPSTTGNITYQLNLSEENIFEEIVEITEPGDSIEEILNEKQNSLNELKTEISEYDFFVQDALNEFLNTTETENKLLELEAQYENAETNEEYDAILENLSAVKIPNSIDREISVNSVIFYPERENVNLDILSEIGGGGYTNAEKYFDLIFLWNTENLPTTITFREIRIRYPNNEEYALKVFRFEFDKTNLEEEAYFIAEKMENIEFEDLEYQLGETNGYLYLTINDVSDTVVFSTTEEMDFLYVPVFISPSIDSLNSMAIGPVEPWKKTPRWALFTVLIIILLMIGVVAYILIQMWYRRRYEAHLFKTRNNLYNIMIYIQNAKKRGMQKEEIIKNLKKAGWTREQINYAIRKYENKKIIGIIHKPLNMGSEETKKNSQKKNTKV